MKKNELTKSELYKLTIGYLTGEVEELSEPQIEAIVERLTKDIELASKKSTSKAKTEKDAKNSTIQNVILDILTDGDMVYKDFIKAVQTRLPDDDLSPQKITANVTKLGSDVIRKYEAGKGKDKKLYIGLVPEDVEEEPVTETVAETETVAKDGATE